MSVDKVTRILEGENIRKVLSEEEAKFSKEEAIDILKKHLKGTPYVEVVPNKYSYDNTYKEHEIDIRLDFFKIKFDSDEYQKVEFGDFEMLLAPLSESYLDDWASEDVLDSKNRIKGVATIQEGVKDERTPDGIEGEVWTNRVIGEHNGVPYTVFFTVWFMV